MSPDYPCQSPIPPCQLMECVAVIGVEQVPIQGMGRILRRMEHASTGQAHLWDPNLRLLNLHFQLPSDSLPINETFLFAFSLD